MNQSSRAIGIVLIAVGALILSAQWVGTGAELWPLFIVLPGLLLLGAALLGSRDAAGLAVPGAIVTTVGLILFLQEASNHYESWAYAWGLVLASVGGGTVLKASLEDDAHERQEGWKLLMLGLTLFAGFGVFFEFFIFGGVAGWVLRYALPLALIAIGAALLWRQQRGTR